MEKLQLSNFTGNQIQETCLDAELHFWETYGGPWQYNQVIGWLRLHVLGSQLRGDLWMMTGKRLQRKSRNQIRHIGKVFEIDITSDETSEQIRAKIEDELEQLKNDLSKKKHVLDLKCFRTIASCIEWRKLMDIRDKS